MAKRLTPPRTQDEQALEEVVERGLARYPELAYLRETVAQQLRRQLQRADAPHAEDLFLAAACATGASTALSLFDRGVLARVGPAVSRVCPSPDKVEEVLQSLRQVLFVPTPTGDARIGRYRGEGPLVGWTRAVALRLALRVREPVEQRADAQLEEIPDLGEDLELRYLRARHRQEFKDAFGLALAQLTVRERAVLRLNLVDGITLDRIGVLYGTHKSTVSRWVSHARRQVLETVRAHLTQTLRLQPTELDGLLAAIRSQLSISLSQLPAPSGDEEES